MPLEHHDPSLAQAKIHSEITQIVLWLSMQIYQLEVLRLEHQQYPLQPKILNECDTSLSIPLLYSTQFLLWSLFPKIDLMSWDKSTIR